MILMLGSIILITFILVSVSMLISKKNFQEMEKLSPVECGMMTLSSPRPPFSLQFFLLAILFMIFDVEMALILPLPLVTPTMTPMPMLITTTTFIIILVIGVLLEWKNGALEWSH
uniref:NADH-ubiquinone oxidoreductase chain 3 n=1 Tax=Endeis sp. JZ-2022 TaxID=2992007 RepID=A0A9E7V7H7_9CHEL|nr:NADH dehydrogenase subunit 3 [Endeis sp. JZ-2022]